MGEAELIDDLKMLIYSPQWVSDNLTEFLKIYVTKKDVESYVLS